jgi:hypothetical protein
MLYPWSHWHVKPAKKVEYALMGREKRLSPEDLLNLYTAFYLKDNNKRGISKHKVFGVPFAFDWKWNTFENHAVFASPCCGQPFYYRWNHGEKSKDAACVVCKMVFPIRGATKCGHVMGFLMLWDDYIRLREYVESKYSPKNRQLKLVA